MGLGPTTRYHRQMNGHFVRGSLTCLKPDVIKSRASGDFPLMLNIEPTNACNARCYYCPREQTVEKVGVHFMQWDLYSRIIDECALHGPLIMINFHKDGESLIQKELPRMVAYAKERNAAETLHLNTNGILLGKPIARDLLRAGLDDLTISVDAATQESYENFKKVRGFGKLEKDIEGFINLRDRIGAKTFIRVKIMEFSKISMTEIEAFVARWESIADMVQVTGVHDWSGAIRDLEITDTTPPAQFPCALLWYLLAVNSNGQVSICNVDWNYTGVTGDANKHTIQEIWQGARQAAIRRSHLEGDFGREAAVCKGCVVGASCEDQSAYFRSTDRF